ncbi:hypothetical protein KAR91_11895, partial [Candidatus Pacearchaeota archaeon]|nr:hypothetical protein [Candidatus Pacearchaeota archaeon]
MPQLIWNNFKMGARRDAALREDALLSAYTMKNFDIVYAGETADLITRKGYDRWNTTELDDPITQLYPFVDMSQNFNLLGVSGSRWRAISEAGAHVLLVDEAATAMRPIESFGDRVFYATDTAAYWSDDTSIGGPNPSYRLGIVRPPGVPSLTTTTSIGYDAGTTVGLNSPTVNFHIDSGGGAAREKIAARYIPAADQDVDAIYINLAWGTLSGRTGMLRLGIYDDNAGSPGNLIAVTSISDWIEITSYDIWQVSDQNYRWVPFELLATTSLTSATTYWIVAEPDDVYLSNYVNTSAVNRFMVAFRRETPVPVGYAAQRYTGAGNWVADTFMFSFMVGGLD